MNHEELSKSMKKYNKRIAKEKYKTKNKIRIHNLEMKRIEEERRGKKKNGNFYRVNIIMFHILKKNTEKKVNIKINCIKIKWKIKKKTIK